MAGSRDPFLLYLERHPEAGTEELKRLFRALAKRTHPDTGAEDRSAFVELQRSYHAAIAALMDRQAREEARPTGNATAWLPSSAREKVLHFLYRYNAHLPTAGMAGPPLPKSCMDAFAGALEAAERYTEQSLLALGRFDEQFHRLRAENARYPDVVSKYRSFHRGLSSFFDYFVVPNGFNDRVARSYFAEIHPVTDYDPTTSPKLRTNRSARARAALYLFTTWLIGEMELGTCRIV
jgi:hypothetical protein